MRFIFSAWLFIVLGLPRIEAQPVVEFQPVTLSGPSLNQPVDITGCGDGSGRLFIVEKRGTIRIIQNNTVQQDFFLDIRTQVMNSGERGLLGLTFHPQFPDSPYLYVNYVILNTITNRISRFTVNPNNPNDALENSELIYLEQTGLQTNHKAGDLTFGPDGYLYFAFGDGGGGGDPGNNGQNLSILLAKMVRINVDSAALPLHYSIPTDNPFVGKDGLDEIWAYGLRNAWRISFDRQTGDFWIADVGQNLWEEIDMIPAGTPGGMNFGWDCQEGNHAYEPGNCDGNTVYTWPIFEYPHSCSPCPNGQGASITGGFVYRGSRYPKLYGYYIAADYVSDNVWLVHQTNSSPPAFDVIVQNESGKINDIVSFGEDDDAELYACGLDGILYRIADVSTVELVWDGVDAIRIKSGNKVVWTMEDITAVAHFEVERSLQADFVSYERAGQVLPAQSQIYYSFTDRYNEHIGVYYRIAAVLTDGSRQYSPVVRLLPDPVSRPALIYDAGQNMWRISLPDQWQNGELILYDLQGKEVLHKILSRDRNVDLGPPIIPGCYFIKVKSGTESWSDRIVL